MKKDIRFLLALGGVIVLLLSPALLTEKILWPGDLLSQNLPWAIHLPDNPVNNPVISDAVEQSYPYYQFFREELSRGRLALWNPYNLNGTPFHANSVSAVFSPIRWLLLPLPIHLYFEYSALLKLLLSGAGIYFFCRGFGLNSASAALGAFGYVFAGYNLFFLSFPNSFVSALFGWALHQVESYHQTGRNRHLAVLALILGSAYLGGNMEAALLQHMAIGLYALFRLRDSRPKVIALTGLGFLVAAAATFPFVDYVLRSATGEDRLGGGSNPFYLHFEQWPALGVPFHQAPNLFRPRLERWSSESRVYIGVILIFLALLSPFSKSRRRILLCLAPISLGSLGVLLGWPGIFELFTALPVLRWGDHTHVAHILQAMVAVMAAIGFSAVVDGQVRWRSTGFGLALAFSMLLVGWPLLLAGLDWMSGEGPRFHFMDRIIRYPAYPIWAAGTLGVLVLLVILKSKYQAFLLVTLQVANGFVVWFFFNTASDPSLLNLKPAVISQVQEYPHDRLVALGVGALPPNFGMSWKIRDLRGYDPLWVNRWKSYFSLFEESPGSYHHFLTGIDESRLRLLARSGCSLILTPEKLDLPGLILVHDEFPFLYRIVGASRVSLAQQVVTVTDSEEAKDFLAKATDPRKVALETETDLPSTSSAVLEGQVSWLVDEPGTVELEAELVSDGWLVLRDSHDVGWVAYLDGERTPIVPADLLFRAVRVPAGKHRIRFEYDPTSFTLGTIISFLSLFGVIWLWARDR